MQPDFVQSGTNSAHHISSQELRINFSLNEKLDKAFGLPNLLLPLSFRFSLRPTQRSCHSTQCNSPKVT